MTEKTSKNPKSWEQQEKENKRQYNHFKAYRNIPINITLEKFHEKINKKYSESEDKSIKPYSLSSIFKLSTHFDWVERRKDFWNDTWKLVGEDTKNIFIKAMQEENVLLAEAGKKILEKIIEILDDLEFKGNKAYAVAQYSIAYRNLSESLIRNAGEPLDISKIDMGADVNLRNDNLKKTQEILGSDEFRKYDLSLLNAINKKQKGDKAE